MLDINKNVTLAHVEQHLKITSETIKNLFNHVKHKNDTELSKEFWKIKKPQQNTKKLHRKLSEYAILTIQTVSAAFYV